MSEKVLFEQDRSANKTIRLVLTEYLGKAQLDLRNYYRDYEGILKPTKQGITFTTPELVDDLAVIFQDASVELRNALGGEKVFTAMPEVV